MQDTLDLFCLLIMFFGSIIICLQLYNRSQNKMIILKLRHMNDKLAAIQDDLTATKSSLVKIGKDVIALDDKISKLQAGEISDEDLAEIKAQSADLRANAEQVDGLTEDAPEETGTPE